MTESGGAFSHEVVLVVIVVLFFVFIISHWFIGGLLHVGGRLIEKILCEGLIGSTVIFVIFNSAVNMFRK